MDVYILFYIFCLLFNLTGSHYRSFIGCYLDDMDKRVLPYHQFKSTSSMTNDRCAMHCCLFLDDATFSGTEQTNECYCGNMESIPNAYQRNDNHCTDRCSGNSSETCGSPSRLSISKLNCSEVRCIECPGSSKVPVSNEELIAKIAAIKEQISVDKTKTSSYKRTKVSAHDARKSSQYIGVGGIMVMVLPIITVIISDILSVFKCKSKKKTGKNKSVIR